LLAQARDKLLKQGFESCQHLSMGMSSDYEAAIAEGSTIVRIGTDIFGPRN
jgi:PLP dependent protein